MNRNVRESLVGGRNIPALSRHRRGHSLTGISKETADENLDLFSRNRRTLSVTSSDESSDGTGLPLHGSTINLIVFVQCGGQYGHSK